MRPVVLGLALTTAVSLPAPALAGPIADADIAVLRAVNGVHSPGADLAFNVLSNEALVGAGPIAVGFAAGDWRLPLHVAEAELVGVVLFGGLKAVFHRARPYETYGDLRTPRGLEHSYSFPSGHATTAFAGATALAIAKPGWAAPAYGWAGLVAVSRMYNGVHYPSDVLVGALTGVASGYLAAWLFQGLNQRLGAEATAPVISWSTGF